MNLDKLPAWEPIPHLTDEENLLRAEQWEIINLIADNPQSSDVDGLWDMIERSDRRIDNLRQQGLL